MGIGGISSGGVYLNYFNQTLRPANGGGAASPLEPFPIRRNINDLGRPMGIGGVSSRGI